MICKTDLHLWFRVKLIVFFFVVVLAMPTKIAKPKALFPLVLGFLLLQPRATIVESITIDLISLKSTYHLNMRALLRN